MVRCGVAEQDVGGQRLVQHGAAGAGQGERPPVAAAQTLVGQRAVQCAVRGLTHCGGLERERERERERFYFIIYFY